MSRDLLLFLRDDVRAQIENGERAIAEGRTVPHDEVEKRFASG